MFDHCDKLLKMDDVISQILNKLPIHGDLRSVKEWPREANLSALYSTGSFDFPLTLVKSDELKDEFLEIPKEQAHMNFEAPGALKFSAYPDRSAEPAEIFEQGLCDDALNSLLDRDSTASIDFDSLFEYHESTSIPPGFNFGVDFTKSAKPSEPCFEETDSDVEPPILGIIKDDSKQTDAASFIKDYVNDSRLDESPPIDADENVITLDAVSSKSDLKSKPSYQFAKLVDVWREASDFRTKVPVLAYQYPFELDTFQKRAVMHMEDGDTVFVAAHTSAGKTAVAEYAVALCQKHSTRVIYTSPIKALSNQKYRDFKNQFGNVGLITGDVQLNTNAFCLIMTTEILRSMLLNKSEVIRDLEWVVFDEVHYVNDQDRGVVWEEVLIFLPKTVKIVMLSATVSNTMEFADWVGRLKEKRVYVISTPKRPVPLEHFLYTGSDGKTKNNRFLLIDKNGNLRKDGYEKAKETKKPRTEGTKRMISASKNPHSEKNMWVHLLDHLKNNDLLPCVAFTFSRRRCDENAAMLTSIDLTSSAEKSHVHHFFDRVLSKLRGPDQNLPQVRKMAELCKRGIAIHHSGILPILKESVEMLFQKGYIKILFATETFAMGINMPARTVLFDSITKHDGSVNRTLHAGEYTQMAGRAGRRGLDPTGTVIIICKSDLPELHVLQAMILGKPDGLISQFRVTYPLLLNALRAEEFRVEDVLRGSFAETSSWREKASRRERLVALDKKLAQLTPSSRCRLCSPPDDAGRLDAFYVACLSRCQRRRLRRRRFWANETPKAGAVVRFSRGPFSKLRGVVLKSDGKGIPSDTVGPLPNLTVAVVSDSSERTNWQRRPYYDGKWSESDLLLFDSAFGRDNDQLETDSNGSAAAVYEDDWQSAKRTYSAREVPLDHVIEISTNRTLDAHSVDALLDDHGRRKLGARGFQKIDERVSDAIHRLEQCLNSSNGTFIDLNRAQLDKEGNSDLDEEFDQKRIAVLDALEKECPNFRNHFAAMHESEKIKVAKSSLSEQPLEDKLQMSPAYAAKLETLKDLGYADERSMLTMKGKVACYVNNFELLVSELMLENVLTPLEPCQIAAVLSCTTCQHRNNRGEHIRLPEKLYELKCKVMEIADRICSVQRKNRVEDNDLTRLLEFGLMHVVYEWAKGTSFVELTKMTSAPEGMIVRCIMRLDEVCRDVRSAARVLGDPELQSKMEQTSQAIHRDIVFAASLYTMM